MKDLTAPSPAAAPRGFAIFLALCGLVLAGSALGCWRARMETLAFSCGVGSLIFAGGLLVLRRPARISAGLFRRGSALPLGWLAPAGFWLIVAAATALCFANDSWDNADYYLSGLALRGYPTSYDASRPPIVQFVAALFADAPRLANAALLLVLLGLLARWSWRRWGTVWSAVLLTLLATQNVFLDVLFGFTSELPAAVLLVAAFLLLSQGRFGLSGLVFALVSLARWNLAVIPLAVGLALLRGRGWRATLRFALGGFAVSALFLGLSFALVEHPLRQIIEGNFAPAYAWAETGEAAPTVLSRVRFYLFHAFFLTPPVLLTLAGGLRGRTRAAPDPADWAIGFALPVGLAAYLLAMLFVGGHIPRFMAPIVPVALLAFVETARTWRFPWAVTAVAIAAAWGIFPAGFILTAKNMRAHSALFSPALREAVARVPHDAQVHFPAVEPLIHAGGLPAMAELRRTLILAAAARDKNGNILPAADAAAAIRTALQSAPPGAYLLIPASERSLLQGGAVMMEDARWVLWRAPGG